MSDAEALVVAALGCTDAERTDWRPFAAEALRAALWSLSSSGLRAVFSTRITNLACELLGKGALFSMAWLADNGRADAEPTLLDLLEELEELGDATHIGNGYHLPAPLRTVPISVSHALLVGGIPTGRLDQLRIQHLGLSRVVGIPLPESLIDMPTESLDEWARIPAGSLTDWTKTVMEGSKLLAPPDEFPTDAVEYYAPAVRQSHLQFSRWTDRLSELPDARYLAKYQLPVGPPRFIVALVQAKRLVAVGSLSVGAAGFRRLQYGLDLIADRPTIIAIAQGATKWNLVLRNSLPSAERRLLAALGDLQKRDDGRIYPQFWTIPSALGPGLVDRFSRLGVRLQ